MNDSIRPPYQTAVVIAGGAFGTSLAFVLSRNFQRVIIKVRSPESYKELKSGENTTYLPGFKLPPSIVPALSWEEVDQQTIGQVELIVSGLPSAAIKEFCHDNFNTLEGYLDQEIPFVSLAKGIDAETLELPDDLYFDFFPTYRDLFCFLSGPSFAQEILQEQITLVSLAGRSCFHLYKVAEMMQTQTFRCFPTYDVKGVLLGGALKNILGIAGGILEGLGFNHNTRAAMITRGIAEMRRFGLVFNARPETFYGLSGMGDLILTSTGDISRNKMFGIEVAKGRKPADIIRSSRGVVEGYKTTKAAYLLSQRYQIRALIFNGLYKVLYKGEDPMRAIEKIMKMPITFEIES